MLNAWFLADVSQKMFSVLSILRRRLWVGLQAWLLTLLVVAFHSPCAGAQPKAESAMSWLENEKIKIGVDLKMGGSITSLVGKSDGRELVNNFDHGRQIQMSFYSGPNPFSAAGKQPHPAWRNLGWNPVQSGDWAGNPSRVLEHRNTGAEMYTRVIPMQWPLDGVEGDCEFESWIRLEKQSVLMRCKLTNKRGDKTFYGAKHQELPAVYTTGEFRKAVTYVGDRPFTGGALSEWVDPGPPWKTFAATEHWAALVDSKNWGLGVWQSSTTHWKQGAVPGQPGKWGSLDDATGYLAPITLEHLDHNIQYEYECRLIPGSVQEIRSLVAGWERGRDLPMYRFERGRCGWTLRGGIDGGFPLPSVWRIQSQSNSVIVDSPFTFWRAESAGSLKVSALIKAQAGRLRVAWKGIRADDPEGSAVFEIPVGGGRKEHTFLLKDQPSYKGGMQRLMLRFEALKPGDTIELESVRLDP